MHTTEWPSRDTEEFEQLMDYIATGGKFPELLSASVDTVELDRKIAELRPQVRGKGPQ